MNHHNVPAGAVMVHLSPHGGQQEVGHEGVATRGGVLSLCSPCLKRKSAEFIAGEFIINNNKFIQEHTLSYLSKKKRATYHKVARFYINKVFLPLVQSVLYYGSSDRK